jgi:hypothetical protein
VPPRVSKRKRSTSDLMSINSQDVSWGQQDRPTRLVRGCNLRHIAFGERSQQPIEAPVDLFGDVREFVSKASHGWMPEMHRVSRKFQAFRLGRGSAQMPT